VRALEGDPLAQPIVPFLNRLSDWFFVLARWLTHALGREDEFWHQPE
jgi:cob(I)alamin adenosyltransferase